MRLAWSTMDDGLIGRARQTDRQTRRAVAARGLDVWPTSSWLISTSGRPLKGSCRAPSLDALTEHRHADSHFRLGGCRNGRIDKRGRAGSARRAGRSVALARRRSRQHKYAPLDQINKDNVSRLRIAWRRPAVDASLASDSADFSFSHDFRATPLMIDGVLYGSNGIGLVEAFNPGTGTTLWIQQPFADEPDRGAARQQHARHRVLERGHDRRLFVIRGEYLVALDPRTGRPVPAWGDGGRVNLRTGLGRGRQTYSVEQRTPGVRRRRHGRRADDRRAADQGAAARQRSGVRRAHGQAALGVSRRSRGPARSATRPGRTTRGRTRGRPTCGRSSAPTRSSGSAYFPLTSATNDMYGGHRLGDNLFANTLVCVRCATGERVWHYQIVHHDLWDYDLPAAPILADITVDGRRIKAVVQVTKQAFAFVFDRTNGQPVWPIEERPVPASDTPGERTSPTQPFPTKPPPFDRQGVSVDDLIDFTPELRAEAMQLVKQYRLGPMFTPPSIRGDGPGEHERHGAAARFGRRRRLAGRRVRSRHRHALRGLDHGSVRRGPRQRRPETDRPQLRAGSARLSARPAGTAAAQAAVRPHHRHRPEQGRDPWMTPNGDGPRDHPLLKPLNLPPLGNPGRGGAARDQDAAVCRRR